jgi:hypothetical protein
MATYHDMNPVSKTCTDALDDDGYVLTLANTGKVAKAKSGEAAYGINEVSTLNSVTGVAVANKEVAVVQGPRFAYVQYSIPQNGNNIAIGDLVSVKGANADGCVLKHIATGYPSSWNATSVEIVANEDKCIVGIAEEAVTASTTAAVTGKLKVRLLCPKSGRQTS